MKKTMIFFCLLVLTMVLGLVSCTNDDNSVYPQKYDGVPLVIFTFSATGNSRIQIPGDDAWRAAMLEKIRNVNKTH